MRTGLLISVLLTALSISASGQDLMMARGPENAVIRSRSDVGKWLSTNNVLFEKKILFDSVTVSGAVYVHHTEFLNEVNIANSTFDSGTVFNDNSVKNGGVQFHKTACFLNNRFLQPVDFRNALAFGNAYFEGNHFYSTADFSKARFSDTVSFTASRFYADAHFICNRFDRVVDFSYCRFAHKAFFSSLTLGQKTFLSFTETILPDTIDFSENGFIPNRIDLTAANFDDTATHYIFLDQTDISQLEMDYEHFTLLFVDPKYPTLGRIDKDRITAIYSALLANFRNANRWSSYNKLLKEYTNYTNGQLNFAEQVWYLYASRPENIVMMTLLVFLVLSLINVAFYHSMDCKVYTLKNFAGEPLIDNSDTKNNFFKKLSNSFIYTGIIFFTFGLKVDELHYNHRRLFVWFFVNYILGLIALFFLTHLLFNTHAPAAG